MRSCEVLGVHVTSCEYMENPERFLEVLGDPGGSWGPWKSREVLGGSWEVMGEPGRRTWEVLGGLGRSSEYMKSPGRSWEVMRVYDKSWEVMGGSCKVLGCLGSSCYVM